MNIEYEVHGCFVFGNVLLYRTKTGENDKLWKILLWCLSI